MFCGQLGVSRQLTSHTTSPLSESPSNKLYWIFSNENKTSFASVGLSLLINYIFSSCSTKYEKYLSWQMQIIAFYRKVSIEEKNGREPSIEGMLPLKITRGEKFNEKYLTYYVRMHSTHFKILLIFSIQINISKGKKSLINYLTETDAWIKKTLFPHLQQAH